MELEFKNGTKRLATRTEEMRVTEAGKMVLIDMDVECVQQAKIQIGSEEFYKRVVNKLIELSKLNNNDNCKLIQDEDFKIFENISQVIDDTMEVIDINDEVDECFDNIMFINLELQEKGLYYYTVRHYGFIDFICSDVELNEEYKEIFS